jgi:hypothetical protein
MKTTLFILASLVAGPALAAAPAATPTATPAAKAAAPAPKAAAPAPKTPAPPAAAAAPAPAADPAPVKEEIKAAPAATPAAKAEAAAEPATAASAELGIAVSARVGAMVPTSGLDLTYFVGLEGSYLLPFLQRLLGVGLGLTFAGPGDSGTVRAANVGGSFDYELSTRLIGLELEALARKSFGPWSPYGGLSYGFYFLHLSETALRSTNTEDQVRAGFGVHGGCGYRLGPGDVVAELRYHYVNLRFATTGKSNAGGLTVAVGYRYGF